MLYLLLKSSAVASKAFPAHAKESVPEPTDLHSEVLSSVVSSQAQTQIAFQSKFTARTPVPPSLKQVHRESDSESEDDTEQSAAEEEEQHVPPAKPVTVYSMARAGATKFYQQSPGNLTNKTKYL